jgi:hypothetical protein
MHNDKLNQPLAVGDRVVYTRQDTGQLFLGTVHGFSAKRVQVREDSSWRESTISKEPDRLVRIANG